MPVQPTEQCNEIENEPGYFPPDSPIWKINREHIILAGGGAAAIMQTAHPLIARGVADYSTYRSDSFGRLTRTLYAVYTIAFGTCKDADKIARRVYIQHKRVHNKANETLYSALDDDLQLWVLATLIMGAVPLYEYFIAPLSQDEKECYLRDMRKWGTFFGVPADYGPQDWNAFEQYYCAMLKDPVLASQPICREAACNIINPPKPLWLSLFMKPLRFIVIETLPSPTREKLGFCSTFWTRTAWKITRYIIKKVNPFLPGMIRYPKQYRYARKRWKAYIS